MSATKKRNSYKSSWNVLSFLSLFPKETEEEINVSFCTTKLGLIDFLLFANKGYSKSIYGQIIQGFGINKKDFQFYKDNFGDIKYGLVAGVYSYVDNEETKYVHQSGELLTLENGSLVAKNKVATVSFDERFEFDVFEMRVGGLVDDLATTKLFCCAYVVANDTIYYLNNERTYEGFVQGAISILEIED